MHICVLTTFSIAMISDPGFVKPYTHYEFQDLMNKLDPVYLCPDCNIIRTPLSRHCNLCNRCVERFDHHCPYLNNCVGYRNHWAFYLFLLFIMLILLNLIITSSIALHKTFKTHPWEFMRNNFSQTYLIILSIICYAISGFFLIFVFLLFITHSVKLCCPKKNSADKFFFEDNENVGNETSVMESILRSEVLVNSYSKIHDDNPKIRRYRTGEKSICEENDKVGLLEGHYIGEMSYSIVKEVKEENKVSSISRRMCYKPLTQPQAYRNVMKQMKQDKGI